MLLAQLGPWRRRKCWKQNVSIGRSLTELWPPQAFEENKLKEIKNGRLAMVAFLGFVGQHAATGKGPVEALAAHIADPWGTNFATNGVSIPGL